ncbi:MAG: hypothetical protein OXH27_10365 [Gammaproteobacteria bacterium]|nr:hypothetical protein [Gammaproteobacteria bacterium]MCY3637355.1 hypothetical protein [bacterium]MYA43152.1 hypothetical protein [Gemmatimonadota bacterium]MYE93794.1 hypothetical protein [Gemmatimonadota bacterium]MYJ11688.1 hypothetical protein [Gemmatimonadota bacterium]
MTRKWLSDGRWIAGMAGGIIGFPLAVVLHELGHFVAYLAFGFPDPSLRYASAGWSGAGEFDALVRAGNIEAASAIAEPWQVAIGAAAGPLVSYLTLIGCILAVRRFGPGPFSVVLVVGLVTPLRWVIAIPILGLKITGERRTSNVDEGWVAELTGIPESLLLLPGLVCLVLGYWILVKAIPRDGRMRVLVPALAGAAVGGILWVQWLGPVVLP